MPRRSTSYKEWLYETLRDKEEAANCLQAASEDSPVALAAISHGPRFQRECSRYLSGWSGFLRLVQGWGCRFGRVQ
jgi:hypothetical protein